MDRAGWGLAPRGRAVVLAALASPGLLAAQEPSPPEHPPPEVCEAGPTLTYLANSAVLIRGAHSVWYARNDDLRPVLDAVGAGQVLLMHFPERRAGDRLFRRSGGWDAVLRIAAESDPPLVPLIRRSRTYCLDPFTGTSDDAGSTEP